MEKKCQVCNSIFKVKPSHFNNRFCCSKKCQNINQKNKKGVLNSNYKGGIKSINCNYCGVVFYPKNYQKRKYCSTICSSKSNLGVVRDNSKAVLAKKIKSKNNPNKKCLCGNKKDLKSKKCLICYRLELKEKLLKINCFNCGKVIIKRYSNKKYCNKICFSNHLQLIMKGANNPNWKNGCKLENQKERDTKRHKDWIASVFERDNYTCVKCLKTGGQLNAHHIFPWAKFKSKRFDLDNGLTLCVKCHKEVHKTKDSRYIEKNIA
jgi:hypothetical protein